MKFNRFIFGIIVLILSTHSAEAFDFRLLSWEGSIEGLNYQKKREVVPLTINEGRLSRRHSYSDSSPLVLFRIVETAEGPQHQPVLSVDLPEYDQAILLVSKNKDGSLRGTWLNDSFDFTPTGGMRFYNFSSHPVAIDLRNKEPILLSPQDTHLHTTPQDSRTVPLLAATTEIDGQWKLFSTLPIPMRSHLRCLIIARNSRTVDARDVAPVEFQIIYDQLQPPPPVNR